MPRQSTHFMCNNKFWLVKNVQQPHLYVVQGRKTLNDFQQEPWLWVGLLSFSFIANVFSSHRAILIGRVVCNLYIFPFSRTRQHSDSFVYFVLSHFFSPHLQGEISLQLSWGNGGVGCFVVSQSMCGLVQHFFRSFLLSTVFGSTITGNNSKNCLFRYSLEEKEFREFKLLIYILQILLLGLVIWFAYFHFQLKT
jgi:hypothetical protein